MNQTDLQALGEREGLGKTLGIEIIEATPERVVARMAITPQIHQPLGFLHGGASVALAETAASIGGWLHCPPGMAAFGQEINANHVRPKREGTLTAVAHPLHIGRSTHIWQIEITDEQEKLVCVSRCTLAVIAVER